MRRISDCVIFILVKRVIIMKIKKGILSGILAGILCLAGVFAPAVSATDEVIAANTIEIDQVIVDFGYASELGRSYTGSFVLKNNSEEEIVVKVTTEEFAGEIAAESKIGKDWLTFVGGKNVYELDGGESTDVLIRFNVPTDAEKGRTQYVSLKATVTSEAGKDDTAQTVAKITTTDEVMNFGGSVENKVTPFRFIDEIEGSAIVKNSGKVSFESTISIRVSPAFGLENWETIVENEKIDVAPGENNASIDFKHKMPFGVYKVEQRISYVNSEGKVITTTNLSRVALCPIWLAAVVGGVLLAVIVLAIVLNLRHGKYEDSEEEDSGAKKKAKKESKKESKKSTKKADEEPKEE